jgi:hypothetical protein
MGRGIVHPVDIMANKPWSEDLLDYLASYLVDNHYDVKKLIEHIATSRAYQARTTIQREETPADDYVFRGPEFKRMTAEQFIDAVWMLTSTGPTTIDAPILSSVFSKPADLQPRKVRASLVRADALMRSLGRPNREQVVTTRPDQLTTLQALDLTNGEILAATLTRGAEKLLKIQGSESPEKLIEKIYQEALCRQPSSEELATARTIVGAPMTRDGVADLLWAVVMLPEFQLIR